MAAQVERQQARQPVAFTQGEMLRLPAQRRAAGADFFGGAEEGAAGEGIVGVVEPGPVAFGNVVGGIVQGDFHGPPCYPADGLRRWRDFCPRLHTAQGGMAA
jgi:hypothetical protein